MSDDTRKQSLDLGSMLEDTLDSIPDLPSFINPPAGSYQLECIKCDVEKYKNKDTPPIDVQRIRITHSVVATKELADAREQPVPDASMFSETFMGTEQGLEYFKARAKQMLNVSSLDGVPLGSILSNLLGTQYDAKLKVRETPKKDARGVPTGEVYENLDIRIIPPAAVA